VQDFIQNIQNVIQTFFLAVCKYIQQGERKGRWGAGKALITSWILIPSSIWFIGKPGKAANHVVPL